VLAWLLLPPTLVLYSIYVRLTLATTAKPRSETYPNGGKINDFESEIRLVCWPMDVGFHFGRFARGIPMHNLRLVKGKCALSIVDAVVAAVRIESI